MVSLRWYRRYPSGLIRTLRVLVAWSGQAALQEPKALGERIHTVSSPDQHPFNDRLTTMSWRLSRANVVRLLDRSQRSQSAQRILSVVPGFFNASWGMELIRRAQRRRTSHLDHVGSLSRTVITRRNG